jgi:hypothetical protein
MALIQGMENANKTGVRFSWCSNGGFLEGVGLTLLGTQFDDPPSAALVNIVPLWKGIDRISIARTVKNQAMVALKPCIDIQ